MQDNDANLIQQYEDQLVGCRQKRDRLNEEEDYLVKLIQSKKRKEKDEVDQVQVYNTPTEVLLDDISHSLASTTNTLDEMKDVFENVRDLLVPISYYFAQKNKKKCKICD